MAQRLKNIVQFTSITPNVPAQLPHGLHDSLGHPLVPDLLALSLPGITVSADAINVTIVATVNVAAVAVYCEAWHTIERSFNDVNEEELVPQPFVIGGGNNIAHPERTLFVAKAWSAPTDPTRQFTSIADAYAAAAAMAPTNPSPIGITVFPGSYGDPIDPPINVVSNVHLSSAVIGPRTVIVNSRVNWSLGVGVNAPQDLVEENCNVTGVFFTQPWTIDASGKTPGIDGGPIFSLCVFSGMTFVGTDDVAGLFRLNTFFPGNAYTFTNVGGANLISNLFIGGLALNGTAAVNIWGGRYPNGFTLTDAAFVRAAGGATIGNVTVGAGCSADLRVATYGTLTGPGVVNRSAHIGTFGPTVAGANPVAIIVPFPDAAYGVALQLVAGPGNAAMTVTGQTDAGFTINDAVGGNTFAYTLTRI